MAATLNVLNKIGDSTLELHLLKAILQVMEAESATLPSTGKGDKYDVAQYVENLLGVESPVVTFARQQLSAN